MPHHECKLPHQRIDARDESARKDTSGRPCASDIHRQAGRPAGSLTGFVYFNANNNGLKEGGETGISLARIVLKGTDDLGRSVNLVRLTGPDGSFKLDNLGPGTYWLQETQPGGWTDGKDTAGTAGGTVAKDLISGIVLGARDVVTGYLFGERRNTAPVITAISSSATQCGDAKEGERVTVSGTFFDPDVTDSHTAVISWGDGSTSAATINETSGSGTFFGSHIYQDGGTYDVTVTLIDDNLASDEERTLSIVSGAGVRDGVLQIIGTDEDDDVSLNEQGNGRLKVHADFLEANSKTFSISEIQRILIILCHGDDRATIAGNITIPSLIDGGAGGNDYLQRRWRPKYPHRREW